MSELISRQAAIDALKVAYWDKDIQSAKDDPCIVDAMTDWAIRQVKALPTVEPKTGEWIEHEHGFWTFVNDKGDRDGWIPDYECNLCGARAWRVKTPFCPTCGARMKGADDE